MKIIGIIICVLILASTRFYGSDGLFIKINKTQYRIIIDDEFIKDLKWKKNIFDLFFSALILDKKTYHKR